MSDGTPVHRGGGRRRIAALLVGVMVVVGVPAAVARLSRGGEEPASAVTVTASRDTYVDVDRASASFGTRTTIYADAQPTRAILLRFDVPALRAPIRSATLRLYVSGSNAAGLEVHAASPEWDEATVGWGAAPTAGPLVGSARSLAAGSWVDIPLTSRVVAGTPLGLWVATTGAQAIAVGAREGARPPELVLSVAGTPEPVPSGAVPTAPSATAPSATPPPTTAPATTAPPASAPAAAEVVVAAAGDIACAPSSGKFNDGEGTPTNCRQKATADLMLGIAGLDAVLALGDIQYDTGELSAYHGSYDRSWGRLKSITYPAVGNHEYLTRDAAGYFTYFGSRAGDPSTGYYSVDLGAWHVVALNSNCSKVGGCGEGSPQLEWLRADLAAHPRACTLAFWHHPLFSSGQHGDNPGVAPLWEALDAAGAELVLAGHDHDYERFAPQDARGNADPRGMRQFVVGTGGKNHYRVGDLQPNSEAHSDDTYGVLRLTLRADGYDWAFLPEPGKVFTDSGSGTCG